MTKTYESEIVQEYHIVLRYTQHIKYIFINPISFYSQGTFNIYVKVHEINFYTEPWLMHEYYDFSKNISTSLRV